MDHTIKNVTKEYAKVCNKKEIISFCYNIVLSIFMLVVCLLPIAKIETYSIGNAFQLITYKSKTIKQIAEKITKYDK